MTVKERSDAARNRQAVLEAAGRLFANAADPGAVTMDDEMLRDLVEPDQRSWIAHALLSVTRVDLIEHLLVDEGWSEARIRKQTRDYAELVLGAAAR
jgi:hypothetical protein